MKKAFLDTNLLIAFVFFLNSLHSKSRKVFDDYDELFWSNFVRREFNRRYALKQMNIQSFFNDLKKYLENPKQELYSYFDLMDFIRNNYSGKLMDDAKTSINPFWNQYFGIETQISFLDMKNAIDCCLKDLSITSNRYKKGLNGIIKLTPQRTNNYSHIDKMLKDNGVDSADRTVTLDGHDFACRSNDPIDFITFDYGCYDGVKDVNLLCFNSIKGKLDFN